MAIFFAWLFTAALLLAALLTAAGGVGLGGAPTSGLHVLAVAAGLGLATLSWPCFWAIARIDAWLSALRLNDDAVAPNAWPLGDLRERVQRALADEKKRSLAAQTQLNEFLAAIQASPNGVTLLSADARIEWCNLTAQQQFGFDATRDRLQLVTNLLRNPDFSRYVQAKLFDEEVTVQLSGARQIALQLHPYAEGRLLLLSRDVTSIEQAAQMRRDFVANVSHEIRTPLTVLAGFIETLQDWPSDGLADAGRAQVLALMKTQSDRLTALVDDLLALSRLESAHSAPLVPAWSTSYLLQKIEQQTQQIQGQWAKNAPNSPDRGGIEVCATPETMACGLMAVESEAHSALSNLVTNALRYASVGGAAPKVRVELQRSSADELLMHVHDQGPGIAPEHLPRLTERFYRIDQGRSRESGGTGLGLSIVKYVMQRHEGKLLIQSELGKGSSFTLVWPAHRVVWSPQPQLPEPEQTATKMPAP